MILYHGWTDPLISPGDAVNYYERVQETVGAANLRRSMRLYMVPGMNHCRGGEGPDDFDMQPVIEQWFEKQKAPGAVIASKITNGKVERTRRLCPYPQVAVWKGTGSTRPIIDFAECQVDYGVFVCLSADFSPESAAQAPRGVSARQTGSLRHDFVPDSVSDCDVAQTLVSAASALVPTPGW